MAGSEPDLLVTNGEVTGQKLFKVRGDPHWHSSPQKARQVHAVLQKAEAQNFFKRKDQVKK